MTKFSNIRGGQQSQEDLDEINALKQKLEELKLPEETKKITDQEIRKLQKLGPRNQEYHVSLNYLQTLSELPWNTA